MSDKIKKLVNKVTLAGKVVEFEKTTGLTKERKIPYISIKGAIQFGDSKVQTKNFEKYVQETNNEGKESKAYPKILEFANKVKSAASTNFEDATEVSVQGSFAPNDYINDQDELKENIRIDAAFFNDFEPNSEYKGNADIEGYIQKIVPETKGTGEDAEETGRLRMTLLTTDFFGNLVSLRNIVIPKELKSAFEEGYQVGQTATFFVDFVVNKAESKPKKSGGLGVQRETEGKSYVEMILTGAETPLDEDEDGAISKEAIKIALSERKAKLDELKEKGYQGSKGKSISSATSNKANSKPAPVNDDEIPF
jgi:hypothetical protein